MLLSTVGISRIGNTVGDTITIGITIGIVPVTIQYHTTGR